jgi:protein-disulfide isomerase
MNARRFAGLAGLGAAAMMALSGCQGSGAYAKIAEQLADIQSKQDTIVAKLDELEKKIGSAPAGRPDKPTGPQPGRPDPAATYKVPLDGAFTKGSDGAKVTIVEWSDFQCPFCGRVNPTIAELQKAYGDDLRVAFKHNPLPMHNRAMPAAQAAEAAGKQGKFWEMHDLMFANARDLTDENFAKWAKELSIDVEAFKKDMNSEDIKKKVLQQQQQGATLGARGTPAFFINGRFLSGAQPVDAFKKVIDEEMKKADKLISEGTPRDKVYDKAIEKGKDKV